MLRMQRMMRTLQHQCSLRALRLMRPRDADADVDAPRCSHWLCPNLVEKRNAPVGEVGNKAMPYHTIPIKSSEGWWVMFWATTMTTMSALTSSQHEMDHRSPTQALINKPSGAESHICGHDAMMRRECSLWPLLRKASRRYRRKCWHNIHHEQPKQRSMTSTIPFFRSVFYLSAVDRRHTTSPYLPEHALDAFVGPPAPHQHSPDEPRNSQVSVRTKKALLQYEKMYIFSFNWSSFIFLLGSPLR